MKGLNIIAAFAVLVCNIWVSFNHSLALFRSGGFHGTLAYVAVIGCEITFIMGALNIVVSRLGGDSPGKPATISALLGVLLVGWSNVAAGIDYGWTGILLGLATPISLICAEAVLSRAIIRSTKKKNQPQGEESASHQPEAADLSTTSTTYQPKAADFSTTYQPELDEDQPPVDHFNHYRTYAAERSTSFSHYQPEINQASTTFSHFSTSYQPAEYKASDSIHPQDDEESAAYQPVMDEASASLEDNSTTFNQPSTTFSQVSATIDQGSATSQPEADEVSQEDQPPLDESTTDQPEINQESATDQPQEEDQPEESTSQPSTPMEWAEYWYEKHNELPSQRKLAELAGCSRYKAGLALKELEEKLVVL